MIKAVLTTMVLALATTAGAQGVVLSEGDLSAADRAALKQAIEAAKAADLTPFEQVAATRDVLPDLDAYKRGRLAPITPQLRALGKAALWPMLEELAIEAAPRGDLADTAWTAWRASLLEAVGRLEAPAAAPVLHAALTVAAKTDEPIVLRAAAEAVARQNTDAAVDHLVAIVDSGRHTDVILSAIGYCRREAVARLLIDQLETGTPARVRIVARSMSDIGNAWSWKLETKARQAEGEQIRATVTQALVAAYTKHTGEAQTAIRKGLLVVAHPSAVELVRAAAEAAPEHAEALAKLEKRLLNNPVATRRR